MGFFQLVDEVQVWFNEAAFLFYRKIVREFHDEGGGTVGCNHDNIVDGFL